MSDELKLIARMQVVRKMLLSGTSIEQIAKSLKITIPVVKKLTNSVIDDLKSRMGLEFDVQVAQQLGRIEMVEQAAWESWEASKTREKIEEKTTTKGDETTTHVKTNKEDAPGDPRYLKVVMECIQERSKLLGLDAIPEAGNVDDVPIVAVVISSRDEAKQIVDAQKFLQVNTIEGTVTKRA